MTRPWNFNLSFHICKPISLSHKLLILSSISLALTRIKSTLLFIISRSQKCICLFNFLCLKPWCIWTESWVYSSLSFQIGKQRISCSSIYLLFDLLSYCICLIIILNHWSHILLCFGLIVRISSGARNKHWGAPLYIIIIFLIKYIYRSLWFILARPRSLHGNSLHKSLLSWTKNSLFTPRFSF